MNGSFGVYMNVQSGDYDYLTGNTSFEIDFSNATISGQIGIYRNDLGSVGTFVMTPTSIVGNTFGTLRTSTATNSNITIEDAGMQGDFYEING